MLSLSGLGVKVAASRIRVGTGKASIDLTGTNTMLDRVVKHSTKALRRPLEDAMREIYASVRQEWPKPTKANRGGNRRKRKQGFNPKGWASTGFSQRNFRWQTFIDPSKNSLSIAVALLNPAQNHPRKGRYLYMAREPYPSRKFYWRELIGKPMRRRSKRLIPELAEAQRRMLEGK